ncbi:sensor histidine kinase [Paenibacillus glycanilyticus]|uniref:sensor histidine kinase n=1 Tax=Paenibacillus glycanilyticus TaxID=126569 RepID=UPI00203B49FA|nr:sensor histidine kinase [Paenibacillus glycanilyticus]MCM3628685.1 sensor histidine kinase [Paenibacillus glycanilyticus]
MADGQASEHHRTERPNKEARRKHVTETVLWLIIIVSLVIIVLQAIGYIQLYTFKGQWAIVSLTVIGAAMAAAAVVGFLQNSKLKQAVERLSEQQRRRSYRVTLNSAEEAEGVPVTEEEQSKAIWKEKVKFSAVIEERQRLARELHDAVSQQLFAISMTATAVSRTIERDWERARRQVQLIEEMASVAQSEMRALLLHLRPVHLDGKNLPAALSTLVDELKQKVPMTIDLDVDDTITMNQEAEDHLFRIAQEALSNTLRHAKADSMEIKLHRKGSEVRMLLKDTGIGFDLEAKKQTSYGLLTMEERVNELGGSLHMVSKPGEGTSIDIRVPIDGGVGK